MADMDFSDLYNIIYGHNMIDGSRRKIMKNLPKNMSVMNPNQMTGSRRKKTGGAPTLKSNLTS